MQRLSATRTPRDARRASLLFILLQYLVRTLPWFIVALCALVFIPLGQEDVALGGVARAVAADRELAYPVLMVALLPPMVLGLMVTSLLAAFMSTVDTHINWGASYIVNDLFCMIWPEASDKAQVRVARFAVVGFAVLAIIVSLQIDTIEQAWKWVAALGAALGVPTALRWVWWRVNAAGELGAMGVGLATAAVLNGEPAVPYEVRLIIISAASVVGLAIGMVFWPAEDARVLHSFVGSVRPMGFWPGRSVSVGALELGRVVLRGLALVMGVVAALIGLHRAVFQGDVGMAVGLSIMSGLLVWLAWRNDG